MGYPTWRGPQLEIRHMTRSHRGWSVSRGECLGRPEGSQPGARAPQRTPTAGWPERSPTANESPLSTALTTSIALTIPTSWFSVFKTTNR
jgi:hypothetical protein